MCECSANTVGAWKRVWHVLYLVRVFCTEWTNGAVVSHTGTVVARKWHGARDKNFPFRNHFGWTLKFFWIPAQRLVGILLAMCVYVCDVTARSSFFFMACGNSLKILCVISRAWWNFHALAMNFAQRCATRSDQPRTTEGVVRKCTFWSKRAYWKFFLQGKEFARIVPLIARGN